MYMPYAGKQYSQLPTNYNELTTPVKRNVKLVLQRLQAWMRQWPVWRNATLAGR